MYGFDGGIKNNFYFYQDIEQVGVTVNFFGGELDGLSFNDPTTVKKYARRSQLGEIFEFDRAFLGRETLFINVP
jgi:photosystem II CP47 chlorophyll apoprotein